MLMFGSLFLMGSYFCYDNVSPLTLTFKSPPYNLTDVEISSLYSVYSFPNMVLPLVGGILLDKTGIR